MKEFKKRFGRYIAMLLAFAMVSNTLFTTQAMASVLVTEDVIEEDVEDVSAEAYGDEPSVIVTPPANKTSRGTSGEERTFDQYCRVDGSVEIDQGTSIKSPTDSTGSAYYAYKFGGSLQQRQNCLAVKTAEDNVVVNVVYYTTGSNKDRSAAWYPGALYDTLGTLNQGTKQNDKAKYLYTDSFTFDKAGWYRLGGTNGIYIVRLEFFGEIEKVNSSVVVKSNVPDINDTIWMDASGTVSDIKDFAAKKISKTTDAIVGVYTDNTESVAYNDSDIIVNENEYYVKFKEFVTASIDINEEGKTTKNITCDVVKGDNVISTLKDLVAKELGRNVVEVGTVKTGEVIIADDEDFTTDATYSVELPKRTLWDWSSEEGNLLQGVYRNTWQNVSTPIDYAGLKLSGKKFMTERSNCAQFNNGTTLYVPCDEEKVNVTVVLYNKGAATVGGHAITFDGTVEAIECIPVAVSGLEGKWVAVTATSDTYISSIKLEKIVKSDFTVSFDVNGGVGTFEDQTVSENELAIEPTEAPTKEGYTFDGWTLDGAKYDFATPVTENITLVAQWKANEYTVSFDVNGGVGTIADQTVSYNNCPKAVTEPTKVGHTFAGWTVSDNMIADITTYNVTDDTTFVAAWVANKYTVSFNSVDGTTVPSQEVSYGEYPEAVGNPTKDGYEFAGWTLDGAVVNVENTKITKDTTFVAKWGKVYTVSCNEALNGSVSVNLVKAAAGTTIEVTVKPEEGYAVKTVSCNGVELEVIDNKASFEMPNNDVVISATFEKAYKITVVENEHVDVQVTEESFAGKIIHVIVTPEEGYEVKSVSVNAIKATKEEDNEYTFEMPAEDVVVTVELKMIDYVVNVVSENVIVSVNQLIAHKGDEITFTVTVEGEENELYLLEVKNLTTKDEITPTGEYTFTMPASNVTITAKAGKLYTVTFDVDGTVSSNKVVSGNKVTKPANPTKKGYEFVEWTLEGEAYDFNTPVTSDITLVATWKIKVFTVKFETNGGSEVENQSVSYNELAKVPANPTKKGHTFAAWTPDIATTYIVDDTTFTAQWTANKYTVSFNVVNGEAATASVEVEYGQKVTVPTVTPDEGYEFNEKWYTDAACTNEYNFDTEVTEGFTLYAKYELKPVPVEYTVSFNAMNGSEITSVKVTENTPVARPAANPTKEGFTFKFWSLDGEAEYDFTKLVTGNITLVAVWEEDVPVPTTFKVTFETNGGSAVAAQDVKSGEKATKPADPTKTGYKFVGWFANSELTTAYDFNTVVTADITIYAKWDMDLTGFKVAPVFDIDGMEANKPYGDADITFVAPTGFADSKGDIQDNAKGGFLINANKDGVLYADISIKGEKKTLYIIEFPQGSAIPTSKPTYDDTYHKVVEEEYTFVDGGIVPAMFEMKAGYSYFITGFSGFKVKIKHDRLLYKLDGQEPTPTEHTVTFDAKNGSAVSTVKVEDGKAVTKPADPTKAGNTFKFWSLDGETEYDFTKPVTGNITLVAVWEAAQPKTYTVTFDSKGGSAVDPQTVTEGAKATKPADPTLKGYAFTGWTLNDVAYDFNAAVTGNITLVATWSKNKEVTPFPENPESKDDVVVDDYTYTFENVKTYTGVAIKPEVLVKYGDTVLVPGVDYTVSYKNNKNISLYDADKYDKKKCNPTSFDVTNTTELEELVKKAYAKPADTKAKAIVSKLPTIVIKGKGNYAGMNDYLYFNIVDLDVTSVGTTDIKGTLIYNGSAEVQKQNKKGIVFTGDTIDPIELGLVSIKGVNKKANVDKVLEPGVDYVYTIANNVNAGTANIFVKYMGDYVGEGKFTFKIAKADISKIETDYDVEGTKFIDTDYAFKVKGNKPEVTEGISAKLYAGADYKVTYKNNVKVNNYITKEDLEKAVKANNKKILNTLPTVTVTGGRNYTGKFVIYFNVVAAELEEDVKVYLPTIKYNAAVSTAKPVVFDADGNIVPASNYVFKYYVNVAGEEVELTAKGVDTGMKDAKGKAILAKTNAKLKNFGQLYTEDEINAAKPADQTAMKIENFLNGVYVKVMPKEVKNANPVFTGMSDEYVIHNATNKLTAKAILTKHGKVTYFTEDGKDIFTGEAITLEGTSEDGKANYLTISSLAGEIAYDDCDVIYNNNVNKGTATTYIIPKVNSDNTKIVPGYVTVKFAIKANNLTKTYK